MEDLEENMIEDSSQYKDFGNVDDIPIVEGGISIDFRKYKGMKLKIAEARQIEDINWYTGPKDDSGRPTYNKDSTEMMRKVLIVTEPLPKLDDEGNPTNQPLIVGSGDKQRQWPLTRKFSLTYKDVNGKMMWTISKAPQAKLWKFMRNQGAKKLSDLIGTIVVVSLQADKDESSDKVWPRISE